MTDTVEHTSTSAALATARVKLKALLTERLAQHPEVVASFTKELAGEAEAQREWLGWVVQTGTQAAASVVQEAKAPEPLAAKEFPKSTEATEATEDPAGWDEVIDQILAEIVAPRVQAAIEHTIDNADELAAQAGTTPEDIVRTVLEVDLDAVVDAAIAAVLGQLDDSDDDSDM